MGVTIVAMTSITKEKNVTVNETFHLKGANSTNILDEVHNNITIESLDNITVGNVIVEETSEVISTNKSYKVST